MSEVAAIELEFTQFLAVDCSGEFRRLGVDLGEAFSLDRDFVADRANFKGNVDASFLRDAEGDVLSLILLEARRADGDGINTGGQGSRKILAVRIAGRLPGDAVLVLVTTTVALGTAAPEVSLTEPVKDALSCAINEREKSRRAKPKSRERCFIAASPSLGDKLTEPCNT